MWDPKKPFNELPPPPTERLESRAVLKAIAPARAALGALDQAVYRIPNPGVLLSNIPLLEAQASSEIENIVTTTDDLFQFADSPQSSKNAATKETLRYRSALFAGEENIRNRPLTAKTAELVCSKIQGHDVSVRSHEGTYIGDPSTRQPRYTPPTGKRLLQKKLHEWEVFVHEAANAGVDPLVVMAAAHYQFEAIHPFSDGNGRTGRILNVLILLELGLLHEPVLYLSRYIIEHKQGYYDHLLSVTRDDDWENWLLFILEGVRATSRRTLKLIDGIEELRGSVREELRSLGKTAANLDLLDVLFEQPYCRITSVMERCDVSRPTATNWLRELRALGVLDEVKLGREVLFVNTQLMQILGQ